MKKILATYIMALIFFSIHANAQVLPTLPEAKTTEDFMLSGNVAELEQVTKLMVYDGVERSDSVRINDLSIVTTKEVKLEFDSNKHLIKEEIRIYDDKKGNLQSSKTVKYTYNGTKLTSATYYEDDKITQQVDIDYDSRDRVYKYNLKDKKGRKKGLVQYSYNGEGHPYNIRIKDENNSMKNFVRQDFNAKGYIREKEIRGNSLQPLAFKNYTYDTLATGSIQVNTFTLNPEYHVTSMDSKLYDRYGKLIQETVVDSNKDVTLYKTVKYDNKGVAEKETIFTDRKSERTYLYMYDDKGNWIEKKVRESNSPYAIVSRGITYHKPKKL